MLRLLLAITGSLFGIAATVPTKIAAQAPAQEKAVAEESYVVDAVHSCVLFRVKHAGVSYAYGRFNKLSGFFVLNQVDPSKSSVSFDIEAASVDTGNAERDEHLRKADFFGVEEHPTIHFESEKVGHKSGTWAVVGKLTWRGVTKDLELKLEQVGSGPTPFQDYRTGFETTFALKRSDFKVGPAIPESALGDEVRVTVSVEAIRQE
jgi:polyisoprenoid-binding protein YceI